eukprot:1970235-Alexandrium_andersonii.AAC.1
MPRSHRAGVVFIQRRAGCSQLLAPWAGAGLPEALLHPAGVRAVDVLDGADQSSYHPPHAGPR